MLFFLFFTWIAVLAFHTYDRIRFDRGSWSDEAIWSGVKKIEIRTYGGSSVLVAKDANLKVFAATFSRKSSVDPFGRDSGLRDPLQEKIGYVLISIRGTRFRFSSREFHLFENPWGLRGIDDAHLDVYDDFYFPKVIPLNLEERLIKLRELVAGERCTK